MAQSNASWDDCMQQAATSDIGMRRTSNQDSYAVWPANDLQNWYERGHLFLVADGMGAHAGGELASKLAADGIPHAYYSHRDKSPPDAILSAITETNAQINQRGEASIDYHNMGTTGSVLLLLPQGAVIAHVGDSRVYRLRRDQLEQLTFDHSLVWEMRATGRFPKDVEMASMVPKNVITRSLGPNAHVQVDLEGPLPIESGDTFLLCTDGLTGKVEDEELGALLASLDPEEAVQVLVDLANLRGGPDNITAIIVKVTGHQITTQVADRASPLAFEPGRRKTFHASLWVLPGLCFLASALMFSLQEYFQGAIAAGGAILAVLFVLILNWGGISNGRGRTLKTREQLGKGPYTSLKCPPSAPFATQMEEMAKDLKEAAVEANYSLDLAGFEEFCHLGRESAAAKDFADSIRQYTRGISHVMQQLRQRRSQSNDDVTADPS
jgi:protein phosphatase